MLSILLAVAAVSGSDEPVKRRDLRYRPNNGYAYQYTSVHNGNREATAFSYQHRSEQFRDEKRVPMVAPVRSIPAARLPMPGVSVSVVAVGADPRPSPRFPSRNPTVADKRRTTVDISNLTKKLVGHSNAGVHPYN